jgi:hypothetical protein
VPGGTRCKNLLYVSANSAPGSVVLEMPCPSIYPQRKDFSRRFLLVPHLLT